MLIVIRDLFPDISTPRFSKASIQRLRVRLISTPPKSIIKFFMPSISFLFIPATTSTMSSFLLITIDPLVNDPDKQQAENSEYQYNNPRVKIVTFYPAPHFQNQPPSRSRNHGSWHNVPRPSGPDIEPGLSGHAPLPVRRNNLRPRTRSASYRSFPPIYPVTSILRLTMSGRHR